MSPVPASGQERKEVAASASARLWLVPLMCAVVLVAVGQRAAVAATDDARAESNFTQHIDVREALGHPDHLGVDFDLRYQKARDDPKDPRNTYALLAVAKGFQTFDRDIPDANSMTGELSLQGAHFAADLTPISAREKQRFEALSNKAPTADPPGPGLTPEEEAEYRALTAAVVGRRATLWTYDLHFREEANHDASLTQGVFGVGGAIEVPQLHQLLDLLPSLIRSPAVWTVQPVRAYLAAEYVAPSQDSLLAFASGKVDRLWRIRAESAWRTRIAPGVDLRAEARADWLPSPPQFVRDAGRELNGFVQVWLVYPLGGSGASGLMIKYFTGRLAPEYGAVAGGKVGLTIGLAPPS